MLQLHPEADKVTGELGHLVFQIPQFAVECSIEPLRHSHTLACTYHLVVIMQSREKPSIRGKPLVGVFEGDLRNGSAGDAGVLECGLGRLG